MTVYLLRAVFHGARFHTISGLCYDPHMTVAFEDRTAAGEARLSEDFVFSQSSLQAYVDCKRRFWLTYLNRVPWPAPPASPAGEYEQLMRQGADFHRAVQRSEEGVTGDSPATNLEYPLESWLASYRAHRPGDLPASHHEVERVLETPLVVDAGARRLMAKYDLIAADTERTVIIDWKTGSRAGRPAILQQKMQSSVYPYVLVEASHALPWGHVRPEQVEMRYWFTAAPESPVIFRYDASQHAAAHARISQLVQQALSGHDVSAFPKVADTPFARKYVCGYCNYRGLCDRGVEATDLAELDELTPDDLGAEDFLLDFSLADVDEIAF